MHFIPVAVSTAGTRTAQLSLASFRKTLTLITAASLAIIPAISSSADQAQDILKKMEAVYNPAKSFESTINIKQAGKTPDGKPVSAVTTQQVRYKAPNLFSVSMKIMVTGGPSKNKLQSEQIVSDGKTFYQYVTQTKQYVKRPAPPTLPLNALLGMVMQKLPLPRTGIPNTTLGKPTNLLGHAVNTILIKPAAPDAPLFSFLIDKGSSKLLRILVKGSKVSIVVDILNQKVNSNISSSVFAFKIPAGSKEIQPGAQGAPGQGGPGGAPGMPPGGKR